MGVTAMYESFFEMKRTPFLRNLPVSELYVDSDTSEIHNRLVYAAQRQLFAVLIGDAGGNPVSDELQDGLREPAGSHSCWPDRALGQIEDAGLPGHPAPH